MTLLNKEWLKDHGFEILVLPFMIWVGSGLLSIDGRLDKLETQQARIWATQVIQIQAFMDHLRVTIDPDSAEKSDKDLYHEVNQKLMEVLADQYGTLDIKPISRSVNYSFGADAKDQDHGDEEAEEKAQPDLEEVSSFVQVEDETGAVRNESWFIVDDYRGTSIVETEASWRRRKEGLYKHLAVTRADIAAGTINYETWPNIAGRYENFANSLSEQLSDLIISELKREGYELQTNLVPNLVALRLYFMDEFFKESESGDPALALGGPWVSMRAFDPADGELLVITNPFNLTPIAESGLPETEHLWVDFVGEDLRLVQPIAAQWATHLTGLTRSVIGVLGIEPDGKNDDVLVDSD